MVVVDTPSPEATRQAAGRLAGLLRSGDVLCFYGDLGAGKTTFAQGLARGLGVASPVTSPTFTLLHEYPGGRLPLFHFDMYRLDGPEALIDLGFDETLREEGVVVIEWPERIASALPKERLEVHLEEAGEDSRRITLTPRGGRWADLARDWERAGC